MDAVRRSGLEAAGAAPECAATIELVRDVLTRGGDKWTVPAITALGDGPPRFTARHERIAGVSQRMLRQTLRSLTRDGLIARTAYAPTHMAGQARAAAALWSRARAAANAVPETCAAQSWSATTVAPSMMMRNWRPRTSGSGASAARAIPVNRSR